jgi:hypothetical protein
MIYNGGGVVKVRGVVGRKDQTTARYVGTDQGKGANVSYVLPTVYN